MNKLRTGFIVILLSISCQTHSYEACHVDVDGNGQLDALTDGLIIIRFLFGISGPALTSNALGAGATRNAEQIAALLVEDDCKRMLDVDANTTQDTLNDGLLLVRDLFGLTDAALIQNAVAANATRRNADSIKSFLAFYKNPREVCVSPDALLPGERVEEWTSVQNQIVFQTAFLGLEDAFSDTEQNLILDEFIRVFGGSQEARETMLDYVSKGRQLEIVPRTGSWVSEQPYIDSNQININLSDVKRSYLSLNGNVIQLSLGSILYHEFLHVYDRAMGNAVPKREEISITKIVHSIDTLLL